MLDPCGWWRSEDRGTVSDRATVASALIAAGCFGALAAFVFRPRMSAISWVALVALVAAFTAWLSWVESRRGR